MPSTTINSINLGPIYNRQNDKVRMWQITICLFNSKHRPISISDLNMDVPEGATAEYFTTNGLIDMKMTNSAPTVITSGKNLGKKNETNVLTQAYNDCASKYRLKLKSGYTEVLPKHISELPKQFPFPMALKPWEDFKHKLKYPLYVQPKLDGLRMIAMLDTEGHVVLKTRRLHDIAGFDKLRCELQQLYDASSHKDIILDGELYAHGLNLQDISGIVRAENDRMDEKDALQYWVFDCFSTQKNIDDGIEIRIERLREFVPGSKNSSVIANETIQVDSSDAADQYYERVVAAGYEGVIYKSWGRPYEFSFDKEKRSSWYLKRKQFFDDEFEIVSYKEGKGKDVGCVIFVLKTKAGLEFDSVPNGTYEYRRELYLQCESNFEQFRGQLAKVQFEKYSKDGKPQCNRMIAFRDLSFD